MFPATLLLISFFEAGSSIGRRLIAHLQRGPAFAKGTKDAQLATLDPAYKLSS
jgi:hypothetical protein